MAILPLKPLPPVSQPWIRDDRTPEEAFSTPLKQIEKLAQMFNGTGGILLIDAVNDVAAAAAGVNVGALYRNGSVVMIRVV